MKIINQTKNTILADDVIIATRIFQRVKGLLDRTAFRKGEALVIKPGKEIHTLFMLFPIDVLFVDKHLKVVKAISSLKPYRLTPIYWRSRLVIELPAGMINATGTAESDQLLLEG